MDWSAVKDWFLGLGRQYGVNPIVFGAIYVGAIPFFSASVAWLVRNYRRRKSIVLPTLAAGFCFVSAYLYLIVAGRGRPPLGLRGGGGARYLRRRLDGQESQ